MAVTQRNVLLVTLVPPFPPADGHRIHLWNLVRALCAEGWSITLVSLAERAKQEIPEALGYLCSEVELVPWESSSDVLGHRSRLAGLFFPEPYGVRQTNLPQLAAAVARHIHSREFAAVICGGIYALPSLPAGLSIPVLVDTQRVVHELLRQSADRAPSTLERLHARVEAAKMRRWEAREGRKVYALGVASERDAAVFRKICPGTRVAPLPNVVDVSLYEPSFEAEQEDLVLFSGDMDSFPNQDAIDFFVGGILPELCRLRPQARLRVVGSCHSAKFIERIGQIANVAMIGSVEDVRLELARAAICAVPLRIASGARMKILEAAAMAKPTVTTTAGATGLDFTPGVEIALADEPKTFARALAELLGDSERRHAMGGRARRRVEQEYNLGVLRNALNAVLDPLAQPRSIAARGGVSS